MVYNLDQIPELHFKLKNLLLKGSPAADQAVEEGGFPDVGLPDDRNGKGASVSPVSRPR